MTKNNIAKLIILLLCVCLIFTGCKNSVPRFLYKSDSVEVVRNNGNITLVSDLVADKEYSFRSVRVKRSEAITEPYIIVDTDTVKIEIIPHGLRVHDKTENKVFTVQRKYLHNKG